MDQSYDLPSHKSKDRRNEQARHQHANVRDTPPTTTTRIYRRGRAGRPSGGRDRRIGGPIRRPNGLAGGEILPTKKYTYCLRIGQMDLMQHASRQGGVGGAEIDGEVKFAGSTTTHLCHVRGVIVAVEAEIVAWDCEGGKIVDFVVGTISWLLVDFDCFDNMGADNVICSGSANGVVRAIQCDRVVRVARPGQVFERADDGDNLSIGIWSGIDNSIRPGVVSIIAAVGSAGVVLGMSGGGE